MIPWGGLGCCFSATALYLLGRTSGRDAGALKSVTTINQLKDLAVLLDTASKVLPLVVTISGRVGSESPIKCEHSCLRGVIVEETAVQHFLKHSDSGSWIQDSAIMLSLSKEVPWYLDDGTGRVFVVGARGDTGLVLPVVSEAFEESGRSIVRGTLDYLQGLEMLGVKRIERVLPTGTSLTVVGESEEGTMNALIHGLVSQKRIDDAKYLFNKMFDMSCLPNLFTCNTIMKGFFSEGNTVVAMELYREMLSLDVSADPICLLII